MVDPNLTATLMAHSDPVLPMVVLMVVFGLIVLGVLLTTNFEVKK